MAFSDFLDDEDKNRINGLKSNQPRNSLGQPVQSATDNEIDPLTGKAIYQQPQQADDGYMANLTKGAKANAAGVLGGQADFVSGTLGTDGAVGDYFQNVARNNARTTDYDYKKILANPVQYALDPSGLAYDLGGGVGSSGVMALQGAAIMAALPASVTTGLVGGLGAAATRVGLPWLGRALNTPAGKMLIGNVLKTPLEAASEGGNVYREMTHDEYGNPIADADKEQARRAMYTDAALNSAILTFTNSLESMGLGKLIESSGGKNKVMQLIKAGAWDFLQNGYEEGSQQGASLYSQGKGTARQILDPTQWNDEQRTESLIGGLTGFGQGAVASGAGMAANRFLGQNNQEPTQQSEDVQTPTPQQDEEQPTQVQGNLVDKVRALQGQIGYYADDGTNCMRTMGIALAGTPYEGQINVDQAIATATQNGQLMDPNNYVPQPGDLAVVEDGNHIVMVTENGGTIQNGASHNGIYERTDVSPAQMFGNVKYYIRTSDYNGGTQQAAQQGNYVDEYLQSMQDGDNAAAQAMTAQDPEGQAINELLQSGDYEVSRDEKGQAVYKPTENSISQAVARVDALTADIEDRQGHIEDLQKQIKGVKNQKSRAALQRTIKTEQQQIKRLQGELAKVQQLANAVRPGNVKRQQPSARLGDRNILNPENGYNNTEQQQPMPDFAERYREMIPQVAQMSDSDLMGFARTIQQNPTAEPIRQAVRDEMRKRGLTNRVDQFFNNKGQTDALVPVQNDIARIANMTTSEEERQAPKFAGTNRGENLLGAGGKVANRQDTIPSAGGAVARTNDAVGSPRYRGNAQIGGMQAIEGREEKYAGGNIMSNLIDRVRQQRSEGKLPAGKTTDHGVTDATDEAIRQIKGNQPKQLSEGKNNEEHKTQGNKNQNSKLERTKSDQGQGSQGKEAETDKVERDGGGEKNTNKLPIQFYKAEKEKDISEEENIANGKKAVQRILNGEESVEGAMYRKDIGDIDFVRGYAGDGAKFRKGYGIAHILAKHGAESGNEIIDKVIETIAKGVDVETQHGSNEYRVRIKYKGYTALLSSKEGSNAWLLSGWEDIDSLGKKNKAEDYASGEGYDSTTATSNRPTLTRSARVSSASSEIVPQSDDKGKNKKNKRVIGNKEAQKKAFNIAMSLLKKSGLNVVTDIGEMTRVLGEPIEKASKDNAVQKMVINYAEGERPADLTPVMQVINGKEMYTVAFYGDRPQNYKPKKVGRAYKLMEQWEDGSLHALFAGTQKERKMGEWDWAAGFTPDEQIGAMSKGLAPRYGWHMGTGVPASYHLMGVGDVLDPKMGYYSKTESGHPKGSKRVWCEVLYDATNDYTDIAMQNPDAKEKDIRGLIPFGGYYMFQEGNLSNWIIASGIKFNRVISEEERQQILADAGYNEELVWRKQVLASKLKGALTSDNKKLNGEKPLSKGQTIQDVASHKKKIEALIQQNEERIKELNGGKDWKYKKRTEQELADERERIRREVFDNPELSTQYLTTDDGEVYGFVKDGSVYIDARHMDAEVPIHEYTHVWDNLLMKLNPKLWEKGKELLRQTSVWAEIKNNPAYADIASDEDLLASEVHSRLAGKNSKEFMVAIAKEDGKGLAAKLKHWMNEFWYSLKSVFAEWGNEDIQRVKIEDFVNMPLVDMIKETNLGELVDNTQEQKTVQKMVVTQQKLQDSADKVLPNTVELNAESFRDQTSQDYTREYMKKKGYTDEEIQRYLDYIDSIAEDVIEVAKRYADADAWQKKDINDQSDLVHRYRYASDKAKATGGLIPIRPIFKKNGEYPLNFDFGSLCVKREAMDAVMQILTSGTDENGVQLIQKVGPTQLEAIKTILKQEGYLVACDVCFVETKRARALNDANKWAFEWKSVLEAAGINDSVKLGDRQSLTNEQRRKLQEMAGQVADIDFKEAFDKYMPEDRRRAKAKGDKGADLDSGITSDKAKKIAGLILQDETMAGEFDPALLLTTEGTDKLFRTYAHTNIANTIAGMFGSATAKPLEGFNIYDNLSWYKHFDSKYDMDNKADRDAIYAIGGTRGQSFTDFNPILFFDYVQLFSDLEIRQLPIHMYTKVPSLVELFGETGAMLNMSLVPDIVSDKEHAGLKLVDGKWEYAWAKESFDVDKAMEFRKRDEYGGRVGTIAVGVSDEHIKKMLDDENIDMIIPFHKSGMPEAVQIKTGLDKATDYTDFQETKKVPSGEKELSYDTLLHETGDPRKAAQAYLDWCKNVGATPKFQQFSGRKNYYKLLENFRGYDNQGNPVIQGPVRVKLPNNFKGILDRALEERQSNKNKINDLADKKSQVADGKTVMDRIKEAIAPQRLDGDARELVIGRLKSLLGKNNVFPLKKDAFLDELEKAYKDDLVKSNNTSEADAKAEAKAKVEIFRTGDGVVKGFAKDGKIYLNEDMMNANTPAHEFSHIWAKVAQHSNPELWKQGVELLKTDAKEIWDSVANDPLYQNLNGDENAIASEVLARVCGGLNEEFIRGMIDPTSKMAKARGMKNALYRAFGNKKGNTEEAMKVTDRLLNWVLDMFAKVRSLFSKTNEPLTYDEFIRMPLKTMYDEGQQASFKKNLKQIVKEGSRDTEINSAELSAESQLDQVRKQYEGTDQWMKAPNGKKTNLTEKQWLQVRTPAFKEWFGDWENDAENASKIVDENGEPRVVYHGTNSTDFNTFSKDFIGMGSGDVGWFGRGFYFALSQGEARAYASKRIIPAFLNLKKPFNFKENLFSYNGKKATNVMGADKVAHILNIAKKYPELAKKHKIETYNSRTGEARKLSFEEFAHEVEDVIANKEFMISEIEDAYGDKQYILSADINKITIDIGNGETHSWNEYGFQRNLAYKQDAEDKIVQAYYYLKDTKYDILNIPSAATIIMETDFNKMLSDMGYDGAVQSLEGDEFVAFEPNQIKSATENTGDFSSDNDDIRYSARQEQAELRTREAVQTEIQKAFPNATFTTDNGRVVAELPNGAKFAVGIKDNIILNAKAQKRADMSHNTTNGTIQGYWKKLTGAGVDRLLNVSRNSEVGTAYHEAMHAAIDLALTEKEKASLYNYAEKKAKENGVDVEEQLADMYRDWVLARQKHQGTIFGKLWQKMKDLLTKVKAMLGNTKAQAESIMQDVESGGVYERGINKATSTNEMVRYSVKKEQPRTVSRQELHSLAEDIVPIKVEKKYRSDAYKMYNRKANVAFTHAQGVSSELNGIVAMYVDNNKGISSDNALKEELLENAWSYQQDQKKGKKFAEADTDSQIKEGVAYFGRLYATDRDEAQAKFPKYFEAYEKALAKDKTLQAKVNKYLDAADAFYQQSPEAKAKAGITQLEETPKTWKEKATSAFNQFYTDWFDDKDILLRAERRMEELSGEKISTEDSAYYQGRVANSSAASRIEMAIKGASNKWGKAVAKDSKERKAWYKALNEVYDGAWKNDVSYQDIVDKALTVDKDYLEKNNFKDAMQALGSYLLANRFTEIWETNPRYKASMSKATAAKVLENAPKAIKDAAELYYKFDENIIGVMHQEGMLSDKAYEGLQKYTRYCPLFRDFSDEAAFDKFMGNLSDRSSYINLNNGIKKLTEEGSDRTVLDDPVVSMVRMSTAILGKVERNKVAVKFVGLSNRSNVGQFVIPALDDKGKQLSSMDSQLSQFVVWENGEKKAYRTSPEIYEVLQGSNAHANAFAALYDNMFTHAAAKGLRQGATMSIGFMIRNFIRDTIGASINSKYKFIPFVSSFKGIDKLMSDEEFRAKFLASGAGMAGYFRQDASGIEDMLQEMAGSKWWQKASFAEKLKMCWDHYEQLGEFIENGARAAEFDMALQANKSMLQAAIDAKEVTLDFSRAGRKGREVNKNVPFFNAIMQGGDKMVRTAIAQPKKTAYYATSLALASMLLWAINHDDDWYKELDNEDKYSNWHFHIGDKHFKVPKPQEFGLLACASVEAVLEQMNGENPKAMSDWAKQFVTQMTPSFFPALYKPILECWANYDYYFNSPVVSKKYDRLKPEAQINSNTSEVARLAGQATGYSPIKIDHLIRGYFGGAGAFVARIPNKILEDGGTPAKYWNEMPVINEFIVNDFAHAKSINDWYELKARLDQEHATNGVKGKPAGYITGANKVSKDISNIRKQIEKVKAGRMDADQKRQTIDRLNARMLRIAKIGLRTYSKYDK